MFYYFKVEKLPFFFFFIIRFDVKKCSVGAFTYIATDQRWISGDGGGEIMPLPEVKGRWANEIQEITREGRNG